jgi:hypothetical protein
MNGNSLGVVLSPGGLAVAERSEGERSEPQRSAATAKASTDPASGSGPDPEVVAKARAILPSSVAPFSRHDQPTP